MELTLEQLHRFEKTLEFEEIIIDSDNIDLKLKYQDVHSDYLTLQTHKIIELINKKITLLHQISDSEWRNELLVKIIELIIVSNYDFRKLEIINYIKKQPVALDPLTQELFTKLIEQKFITLEEYNHFLAHTKSLVISKFNRQKLLQNLILTNLSTLPKYYKSIYIGNLSKLLGMEIDEITISRMISNGDLPGKINQLKGLVVFEEIPIPNKVYKIIDDINNDI